MTETPLSRGMKLLCWLMILQALGVAVTLIFFPTQTETLFFWKITPPINAVLVAVVLAGLWLRWLQRLPAGDRSSLAVS